MTASASAPTKPRTLGRIIGLEGARGLSCLGVAVAHITGHYSPHTTAETKIGLVGLSLVLFYVLSGFLLFLPYIRNLTEPRSSAALPSTKNFALHRIARILPGYLVIFLVVNFVFRAAYVENPANQPVGSTDGTGMITNPWQLLANLTLVQTYIPRYIQTGLNPSWSLTLEYAFYAVLPALGVLLFAMRRRTGLRPFAIAAIGAVILLVIGFIGRGFVPLVNAATGVTDPQLQEWGANWSAVFVRSFLTNADNFAVGMLAAIVVVAMEQEAVAARLSARVRLFSTLALMPMLAIFFLSVAVRSPYATAALGGLFALFILIVVAPLARGQESVLARWMDVAPVRYIGKVSLSAYLWHFPILIVLGRWGLMAGDTLQGMLYNVVVVLAVTILVSTVTYYLVEQPVMTMTRRYRHRWT